MCFTAEPGTLSSYWLVSRAFSYSSSRAEADRMLHCRRAMRWFALMFRAASRSFRVLLACPSTRILDGSIIDSKAVASKAEVCHCDVESRET